MSQERSGLSLKHRVRNESVDATHAENHERDRNERNLLGRDHHPDGGGSCSPLDDDLLAFMPLLFTGIWNIAGNPALSIPAGVVDSLPVGMQVVGRPSDEDTVLRVGRVFQQRTDWHRRMPGIVNVPSTGHITRTSY
jgi:hypothetical protein